MLGLISLRGPWPANDKLPAASLWAEKTVVLYAIRRMGCPLCRRLAAELHSMRSDFEKAGARLVVVSAQPTGAQAFLDAVWSDGELYVDEDEGFKKALGENSNAQKYSNWWLLRPGSLLNIFRSTGNGKSFDDLNAKSMTLGGEFVIHPSKGVVFQRREDSTFGHASGATLLEVVRALNDGRDVNGVPPTPLTAAAVSESKQQCDEKCDL